MEQQPRSINIRLRLPPISWKLILALLLVIGLLVGSIIWFNSYRQTKRLNTLFPQSLRQQAGFSLYYPSKLPTSYAYDRGPAVYGAKVVSFGASNNDGKKIVISQQARPKKLDFNKFYKANVEQPQKTKSPEGEIVSGKLQSQQVCSLVTKTTWVIIATPGGYDGGIGDLCKSLVSL